MGVRSNIRMQNDETFILLIHQVVAIPLRRDACVYVYMYVR